jgi:hypothetical protein
METGEQSEGGYVEEFHAPLLDRKGPHFVSMGSHLTGQILVHINTSGRLVFQRTDAVALSLHS